MKNKRYFPLYVDLSDKNIVVVGGGTIATRRGQQISGNWASWEKFRSSPAL